MDDLFLLSERQMALNSPFFPLAHGVPRVDDRRVVSGIVYVIRNGLQWKDAPKGYGPPRDGNRMVAVYRDRLGSGGASRVSWRAGDFPVKPVARAKSPAIRVRRPPISDFCSPSA